eukprot:gene4838-5625_t
MLKRNPNKKKQNRSVFYRISAWLHLWLGLATGIVMIIVCLTGCLWIFKEEIDVMLDPTLKIEKQDKPYLKPSDFQRVAKEINPEKTLSYVLYQHEQAAYLVLGKRGEGLSVRVNPYSGKVIQQPAKEGSFNFFDWALRGHRFLWLSPEIGRPIVNYSTLIFMLLLLTGLVLWWPKKWNKSTRARSFSIKWGASVKRINYDLHNVLGFYALIVLLIISATGVVYGLQWWSKSLFWSTSMGKQLPVQERLLSDSTQMKPGLHIIDQMDKAWDKFSNGKNDFGFYYAYPKPEDNGATINFFRYPTRGKFYDLRSYTYDRYSLQQFKDKGIHAQDYHHSSAAVQLRKMNYDLHIGSVFGLPGKILAFTASLIGLSLPITGFIIWWPKKRKKKNS